MTIVEGRLVVNSSLDQFKVVQRAVVGKKLPNEKELALTPCNGCLTRVSNPYTLHECGHSFCSTCMNEILQDCLLEQVPIACHCGSDMCLADIQALLPHHGKEVLFGYSRVQSVRLLFQYGIFKQCSSRRCTQIFRDCKENEFYFCRECSTCVIPRMVPSFIPKNRTPRGIRQPQLFQQEAHPLDPPRRPSNSVDSNGCVIN
jgi:hypothetical protein